MKTDWEKNKWYRYRTIEKFTYRSRMRVVTALLIASYVVCFGGAIIIPSGPYVTLGFVLIFLLGGLHWFLHGRITKNQTCPKCKRPCEDKESSTTGEVYLVCHECEVKWDTGIDNSNWE